MLLHKFMDCVSSKIKSSNNNCHFLWVQFVAPWEFTSVFPFTVLILPELRSSSPAWKLKIKSVSSYPFSGRGGGLWWHYCSAVPGVDKTLREILSAVLCKWRCDVGEKQWPNLAQKGNMNTVHSYSFGYCLCFCFVFCFHISICFSIPTAESTNLGLKVIKMAATFCTFSECFWVFVFLVIIRCVSSDGLNSDENGFVLYKSSAIIRTQTLQI